MILIEPGDHLYDWIEKISNLLTGFKTLFLMDDIIADENLDKQRQLLLELAISGRHRGHSLWLLTQLYTAFPKNIRRQAKMLYVIETQELANVKKKLKQGKHTCLIMRMEHPRAYEIR